MTVRNTQEDKPPGEGPIHSPSPQLNYAEAPRARGLRRAAKWGLLFTLCITAAAGYHWRGQARAKWDRAGQMWEQRRCLAYTAPLDRIVYSEDPQEAPRLLKQKGYFAPTNTGRIHDVIAAHAPDLYVKQHGSAAQSAVVFFHERKTPKGKPLLVLVSYECNLMVWPACTFGTRELKTWKLDPPPAMHGLAGCMDARPDPNRRRLTLYAGQPDENDPTHFTIAYRAAGQPGMIDGYVRDDESISITVRDGPAAGVWDVNGAPVWERPPLE